FQAEDGIRDRNVTGVQTCALPIFDLDVRQALEASFTEMNQERIEKSEAENLMKKQKSEIQASQHAYILEQMAVQLKELANNPLRSEERRVGKEYKSRSERSK